MTSEPVVQSWPSMMSWVDPHPFNWVNSIKTQRNAIYGRPQKPTLLRSSPQHRPTLLAAATARQPAVRRAPFSPTGRLHYTHLCPGICTIFSALKSDLQAALQPCSASLLYPTLLMHDFLVLKSELQAAIRSGTFRKLITKPQVTHWILPVYVFHR